MTTSLKKWNMGEFKSLQTSTRTFMVYTNLIFDMDNIFTSFGITSIPLVYTKRNNNLDKKKLTVPEGSIISLQRNESIRGVDTRKSKKQWCKTCRLMTTRGTKVTKNNSVVEILERVEGTDIQVIKYKCKNCDQFYSSSELGTISHFLNQVTLVICINGTLLNVMVFKDSLKIAGCKDDKDAFGLVKVFWNFLKDNKSSWKIKEGETDAKFLSHRVMRNVKFKLGFNIDLNNLNTLMNKEEYREYVAVSQRETTGHPNVNIAMKTSRPDGYNFDVLVYKGCKDKPELEQWKENPYRKKAEKNGKITFIAFSSSQIILSGCYDEEMEKLYNFFVKAVMSNRELIEEKLYKPDKELFSLLKEMEVS